MATHTAKARKRKNLQLGESQLEQLVAMDYRVVQYETYHFRINNRLDVWPSTRKWYDLITKDKGHYDDLLALVKKVLN